MAKTKNRGIWAGINPRCRYYEKAQMYYQGARPGYLDYQQSYFVLRTAFPYGFVQDEETGKIVFFNRDYEILTFMGKKEFDFDPSKVLDDGMQIGEGKFLMGADGSVYVGRFYMFFIDYNEPFWMEKALLENYLRRLSRVMLLMNDVICNAFDNGTATGEQCEICDRKFDRLEANS